MANLCLSMCRTLKLQWLCICSCIACMLLTVIVYRLYWDTSSFKHVRSPSSGSKVDISANSSSMVDKEEPVGSGILPPVVNPENTVLSTKLFPGVNSHRGFLNGSNNTFHQEHNPCVPLKCLSGKSTVCIHDPNVDKVVSKSLFDKGVWEYKLVTEVERVLMKEPNMTFLDIGCNLGVYSICAAKLVNEVLAVDADITSLKLLEKSLRIGNIEEKVKLVSSAIADKHMNVTLVLKRPHNHGATYVLPENITYSDSSKHANTGALKSKTVPTITLDDLTETLRGKRVFMKMDIESYEYNALIGGEQFFEQVDVGYVLMEWVFHRKSGVGMKIIYFMFSHGFLVYDDLSKMNPLIDREYNKWPINVIWIKKNPDKMTRM